MLFRDPSPGEDVARGEPGTPHADDTLGSLVTYIEPLGGDDPTSRAYDAFSHDPALYALAVVDDKGSPIGIINRFRFLEALSRPFAREQLIRRRVVSVMDAAPLVVDERMPLDRLSEILVDDATKYIFDGFIVTREGKYLGMGTGYSLMRRLTERRQSALFHLAHHDALTGLPNRQLFADRLTQALAHAERNDRRAGVLFIDVDRLKTVNDTLGHAAGDLVLRNIAARLRIITRAQDTVARLSGDEFAMVVTELGVPENAEVVASKLLESMREAHQLDEQQIDVTCSIGFAVFPDDGRAAAALMAAADDAMYHAKQFRNTIQRYSADMQRADPVAILAFSEIRAAIAGRHLEVHYQPLVTTGTRDVCGFAALVRWRDPCRGLRSTLELIRSAEDAGVIGAVTDYVAGEGMRRMLGWRERGLAPDARLAVNVSSVEMRDGTLIPMLERHLAEKRFPPASLELLISESTVMRSDASTIATLRALRQMGIRIVVDDFGAGYSSLSRLQRLAVDGIKIDRSFVECITPDVDGDTGAVARTIIVMAHSMRLAVTAKCVENPAQAAFLEAHGCDRLQGHLISPPMTAAEVETYLLGR
jgi:diguanylate cyclase (GGDEF)-like protein